MIKQKTQKNAKYVCDICDFKTGNKTDYNKHLMTPKHINNNELITNHNEKPIKTQIYKCLCGNEYKYYLYFHQIYEYPSFYYYI